MYRTVELYEVEKNSMKVGDFATPKPFSIFKRDDNFFELSNGISIPTNDPIISHFCLPIINRNDRINFASKKYRIVFHEDGKLWLSSENGECDLIVKLRDIQNFDSYVSYRTTKNTTQVIEGGFVAFKPSRIIDINQMSIVKLAGGLEFHKNDITKVERDINFQVGDFVKTPSGDLGYKILCIDNDTLFTKNKDGEYDVVSKYDVERTYDPNLCW